MKVWFLFQQIDIRKGLRMRRTEKAGIWKGIFYLLAVICVGFGLTICMQKFHIFPDQVDTDTYGHLFKINYLYHALKEGDVYPIYTEYWYNGMELFRYWPPFSYYVVAGLQFITKGNVISAFCAFAGVVYVINVIGWFLFGRDERRFLLSFALGNLYFFCPDNMRVFMAEGNIPRIFITSLLPATFYLVWQVLEYGKVRKILPLIAVMWVITATHYMIAAMTGISIFLFCVIHGMMHRRWQETAEITVGLVLSYLAAGIFLLPGLTGGGLTSQTSEASVATSSHWAQEALKSVNPFYRVDGGSWSSFYFGLVIFIILVLGVIAANKRTGAGFGTTLLIFLSTTTVAASIIRLLPLSQVLWMQRFVPMAMCTFFLSLFLWKQLRKAVLILFIVMMLLDTGFTAYLTVAPRAETEETYMTQEMDDILLWEAKELTKNRLGIVDNSLWGAMPSYALSENMDENSVAYSFGWAYQGAKTMENIVRINEAAQNGFYTYAFDRLLELGDDVILVSKELIEEDEQDALQAAASKVGYQLVDENENAWLFKLSDIEQTFGIVKQYKNLAIGENAGEICYIYPQFGQGDSNVLEDYSLEELTQYQKLYLSGFQYEDKDTAENLLRQASEAGVQIYIDMQHIPLNKLTGKAEFLGVYAQHIEFTEKFPILSTDNGSQFKLDFQTIGYAVWNTVYLSGASENLKTAYYDNATNLAYVARDGDPNITFLGFNPVYYYQQDPMPELLTFLNEVFAEEPEQIAASRIVPITVTYEPGQVTITAPEDDVNSGIAALDCFHAEEGSKVVSKNNLLTVSKGRTILQVSYTGLLAGAICSAMGLAGSIFYGIWIFKNKDRKKNTLQENTLQNSDLSEKGCVQDEEKK